MRIRSFEVLAVIVVVAVVVGYGGLLARKPEDLESRPLATVVTTTDVDLPQALATPAPAARAAAKPSGNREQIELWKALYDEAQAMLAQGDNSKAEARLVAALKLAPMAGEDALHETLDDLGLVCYRLGEYQRCADYQQRAVEAASHLSDPQRTAVMGLYETRLASALEALSKHDEALAALGRARQDYIEAYPAGSPAYSEALNSLAAQHRTLGDNEGAARVLEDL